MAMPQPGDLIPYSFTAEPGRCLRMVYSPQLQATHCAEPPVWKEPWKDRKGKVHQVEACGEHAPKSAGTGAVQNGTKLVPTRSSDKKAIERSGTD